MKDRYTWPDGHQMDRVVEGEFVISCPEGALQSNHYNHPEGATQINAYCMKCDEQLPEQAV